MCRPAVLFNIIFVQNRIKMACKYTCVIIMKFICTFKIYYYVRRYSCYTYIHYNIIVGSSSMGTVVTSHAQNNFPFIIKVKSIFGVAN